MPTLSPRILLLGACLVLTSPGILLAQEEDTAPRALEDPTVATIRTVTDAAEHPLLKWSYFPHYQDELQDLYGPRDYQPFWIRDGVPRRETRDLLLAISEAGSKGLDPGDYDYALLDLEVGRLEAGEVLPPDRVGLLDSALSIALFRYVSDLHIGKINPANLSYGFNIEPKKYDLAKRVREMVEQDHILEGALEAEPRYPLYWRLQRALNRYQVLAATNTDIEAVPEVKKLTVYDPYDGVRQLAARLRVEGDLTETGPFAVYDSTLFEAVKRFQYRHGLAVDGVVGPATFAALNVPMAHRLRQIELALERMRWLPLTLEGPILFVNLPAFQLWAIEDVHGTATVAFTSRVVVGKDALDTRTPAFKETMEYVVFNPYWNVPYSIITKELVPKIRADSTYLDANNYEIVDRFSWAAEAIPLSDSTLALLGSGALKIRQKPGGSNALGGVKFIFPNAHNVYLHSTPETALFRRAKRDFSHGCIRVQDVVGLAEYVLAPTGKWPRERIVETMEKGEPERVFLPKKFPVIIFYSTVVVDDEETVFFYEDVYGHDTILDQALSAGYPYPP